MLATVGSSSKSELEFWDLDFTSEDPHRREGQAEWGGSIQLLGTADHYGVTDVEWDPSGRYLATSASAWTHTVRVVVSIIEWVADLAISSLKMVSLSGTSVGKNLQSRFRIDSNNLFGVHGPLVFSVRKDRSRLEKISGISAVPSMKMMQQRKVMSVQN